MQKMRKGTRPDPMPELKYLPIFYLFPQELLDVSEFADFPRNPHTVRNSPEWMERYNSEKFFELITDGTASLVWRHFGIKASMESFSGYHPFWMMAHSGVWIEVAAEKGFNTYSLATAPPSFQMPILAESQADNIFKHFVDTVRARHPFDAWIEAVKEFPAHEDYEPSRQSRGSIEFFRKWYHSRALTKVFYFGDEQDWEVRASPGMRPYDLLDYSMDLERFLESLDTIDRVIFKMEIAGYTQKEIAKRVGYATHSAVGKRLQKIRALYKEKSSTTVLPRKIMLPLKNNWDEMTNLLFLKASPKSADS